jgi:thioredoxin:protein disulfide reductase
MMELAFMSVVFGLAVAFSPCQLPVYPVLLGIMSFSGNRKIKVIAFSIGYALMYACVYVLISLFFKLFGGILLEEILQKAFPALFFLGGALCTIFALQILGFIKSFSFSMGLKPRPPTTAFGSFISGALMATIVSPCNMPFLIAFFFPLLLNYQTTVEGVFLVLIYSFSATLPLFLAGFMSDFALTKITPKRQKTIKKLSAAILLLTASYLFFLSASSFFWP